MAAKNPARLAPALVWFRQDLRLADNPALCAAAKSGKPVVCVYVLDDETPGRWKPGGASRWWLHHSLEALAGDLAKLGAPLVLRRGAAAKALPQLIAETGADLMLWNRAYEPYAVERDKKLKASLGVEVQSFSAALLHEPCEVKTKSGEAFKVYTPFWRAAQALPARAPLKAPRKLEAVAGKIASDGPGKWQLLPTRPNWAKGFDTEWRPGEAGAKKALAAFLKKLSVYPTARDLMGEAGTSRLSPHLHFGEISPAQIAAAIGDAKGGDKYLSEIGWRDFAHNLLFHWPTLPEKNWRDQFDRFPWRDDPAGLEAWKRGRTGYPIVDAAMRQLWTTGWMHNRARMIAASFLIKHLMIDWREGEAWFWDTLVDADLANNAASWQWVAGSGADAAPYFRIFNPVAQGERYDPDGTYVRRWVPELGALDAAHIHAPWAVPGEVLRAAGVSLGPIYPEPVVDHAFARQRALAAFAAL